VDEKEITVLVSTRSRRKVLPQITPTAGFQNGALPEDRSFSVDTETIWVEHHGLIVVTQDRHVARHRPFEARDRIGTVSKDVAKAEDVRYAVLRDISEYRVQGFEVRVDVAEDGPYGQSAFSYSGKRPCSRKYRE